MNVILVVVAKIQDSAVVRVDFFSLGICRGAAFGKAAKTDLA